MESSKRNFNDIMRALRAVKAEQLPHQKPDPEASTNRTPPNPNSITQNNRLKWKEAQARIADGSERSGVPEDLSNLQSRIRDEVQKSVAETFEHLAGKTPQERKVFLSALQQEFAGAFGTKRASGASEDDLRRDFEEFEAHAAGGGEPASLAASGNAYARMAQGKIAGTLRQDFEERAKKIAGLEVTKKFGMLANMKSVPGLSLAEFGGRISIEAFIAYVAYQSAQNAVFLTLSQMASTSSMSGEARRAIAVGVAALASYSAFKFRHSIYTAAQDWGADGTSALKTVASPKNIAQTGFRAGMAGLVAFGGAIAITKAINISEKMSGFGDKSQEKIRPVSESLDRGADIMSKFFEDLQARQDAIVNVETGAATGIKGAGKSAGKGYGIKAAHKDYLFNGRFENKDKFVDGKIDPALVTFRTNTLQMPDNISITAYVRQLWEKSAFEAQRTKAKKEIDILNGLLEKEKGQNFNTRLVKTTLKQVDDPTVIPHQVELALAEIQKLVEIHHTFKARADGLFAQINAEGLALAKAAGQGIDVRAPEFTIDVSPLGELPNAPGVGENSITISDEDVRNVVEFFEKQPGMAWFGEFVKDDDASHSRTKIILSFMALYFGIENMANLIFAMRELSRRRREKKEVPEKIRDIYALEDIIATEIAFTVLQHSPVYAGVLGNEPERIIPIVEQLKSRVRFFLREKAESADPRLSEDPTWSEKQWHRVDHISNILIDRGPERIRHVDGYIAELEDLVAECKDPNKFAALLMEIGLPGARDIASAYDPKSSPPRAGTPEARLASAHVEEHIGFLIGRIQARKYVLDTMRSDIASRAELGADAVERASKFWSGGIMMQLDGTGTVSVGLEDAKFFESYARLSQEEDSDETELARLVQSGRTMMMRSLFNPASKGVIVPAALTDSFVEDALTKPLSVSQSMVDAYKREIREYMQGSNSAEIVSRQLSSINTLAVPDIMVALGTQPHAQDYRMRAEYAYSREKRGPVFRIGIYDPTTNVRVGTAEYHTTVPNNDSSSEELAESIRDWYTNPNPGALEIAARILHARMRTYAEQTAGAAARDTSLGKDLRLTLSGFQVVSPQTLDTLTRVATASALLERQALRLSDVKNHPLSQQQLGIFQIPDTVLTNPRAPLETFLDAAPVHAEGVSELVRAIPEIRSLLAGYEVVLDVAQRKIRITAGRNIREARFQDRTVELDMSSLYDIGEMKRRIDKEFSNKK
ncbi:MAG: hypothetical protein WAZ27_03285 [Minisyncoccia bacterium]